MNDKKEIESRELKAVVRALFNYCGDIKAKKNRKKDIVLDSSDKSHMIKEYLDISTDIYQTFLKKSHDSYLFKVIYQSGLISTEFRVRHPQLEILFPLVAQNAT